MALRWALGGGNFFASTAANAALPGFSQGMNGSVVSTAPAGGGDTYAIFASNGARITTVNLGGNFGTLYAGVRIWTTQLINSSVLIAFYDAGANPQCDLRINGSGQLFFTRNGTTIGSTSTGSIPAQAWVYIEFKAIFSNAAAGTCEARINGVTAITSTGLTNSVNGASGNTAALIQFEGANSGGSNNSYIKDMYAVDSTAGAGGFSNTSYLGDIRVYEVFPNGAGVNGTWLTNVGPFTLTAVSTANVFTGTITGGAGNVYVGYNFNVTGFANGANNVNASACVASNATALILSATGLINETHAGSAAFQNPVQIGINQTGTRPNGDNVYITNVTAGNITDYAHQALTVTGTVLGVEHLSEVRKDDAGTHTFQQLCISNSVTEVSTTDSAGGTYQYWLDILENDPNTNAQFGLTGFNNATFGVKCIS